MHIVYWSHSYRKDDAAINRHFGVLIEQAERIIINFDPPSETVNESKLDQNLRSCDGMIAVLSWRQAGPSAYILHEIGLALRARKPLLVLVDDRLPDNILPARILQRRFSHRLYFRQFREHTQAIRALKSYMGDPPPLRYQPRSGQRTCGVVGLMGLSKTNRETVMEFIGSHGYRTVNLERVDVRSPLVFDRFEHLANLDVAVWFVDTATHWSAYWGGALSAAAIPTITITMKPSYPFMDSVPREFQPRTSDASHGLEEVLGIEFNLYEQEFLKAEDTQAIERYTAMQVQAGFLAGRYETDTRRQFVEVVMGDKYTVGQAGAVGPGAQASNITFNQVWNQLQSEKGVDLGTLADQLQRLREVLEREASEPDQKFAAGAVAAAEQSARQKDGPKTIEYLKSAGKWALSTAQKIGVNVATEALKSALGM